ncbi:hypothetical protein DFH09DRAFT_1155308 [Mycena vulgaris]|nr:hypothetical protein DFH09DRAFT_1155308 [Mycena vulgaris]
MSSTNMYRERVAHDTIRRTPDIIREYVNEGASSDSTFFQAQLPDLEPLALDGTAGVPEIKVINSDSFTAARNTIAETPDARGKIAVLNLASDEERAGGWMNSFTRTQEEALCYSSTLYATLKPEYYPWPNLGPGSVAGVFSPGVVVFKDDLDHECADLLAADRCVVSNPSDLDDLRGKIRLVYRMATHHGKEFLVLAAMGCGAYLCPPKLVAEQMKSILLEDEFRGRFQRIIFAIYSSKPGPSNFELFHRIFDGVKVDTTKPPF